MQHRASKNTFEASFAGRRAENEQIFSRKLCDGSKVF